MRYLLLIFLVAVGVWAGQPTPESTTSRNMRCLGSVMLSIMRDESLDGFRFSPSGRYLAVYILAESPYRARIGFRLYDLTRQSDCEPLWEFVSSGALPAPEWSPDERHMSVGTIGSVASVSDCTIVMVFRTTSPEPLFRNYCMFYGRSGPEGYATIGWCDSHRLLMRELMLQERGIDYFVVLDVRRLRTPMQGYDAIPDFCTMEAS